MRIILRLTYPLEEIWNKIIKFFLWAFVILATLYPLFARYSTASTLSDDGLLLTLFPYLGLIAFVLMWLHVVGSVFQTWLERHINFQAFTDYSSIIVLICIVLHPLLLFLHLGLNRLGDVFLYGPALYIWLGIIAWCTLIIYDIGKLAKFLARSQFFYRHWNKILLISTIGFLIAFFHSLGLGSDLQSFGPLRLLWIFYGITGILATIYTYGIKRFIEH
jgi:hypothetical protein